MTAATLAPQLETALERMMIATTQHTDAYVGVDLVEVGSLARQLAAGGDRLACRWFTASEREFCDGQTDRLASTLAGKEAVAKVLRTGFRAGVRWTHIEIVREPTGGPFVRVHDAAGHRARQMGIGDIALSLSHEGDFAVATALALAPHKR